MKEKVTEEDMDKKYEISYNGKQNTNAIDHAYDTTEIRTCHPEP